LVGNLVAGMGLEPIKVAGYGPAVSTRTLARIQW
jgi:hypothetical protein